MHHFENEEKIIQGISGSPGICIGKSYLVDKEGVDVVEKYSISEKDLKREVGRFKTAVKNAKNELSSIIEGIPEELREHAYILETHLVLHKDKMLYGKTIETIEKELINSEWALKKVVSNIKIIFRDIEDTYLKDRVTDIVQVADRIMRNLTGAKSESISEIDKRVVLVAHDLSPADTSQIKLERIKGFVTDLGGKASHTSIIARTLGIPSVLGLDMATRDIKNDEIIVVDGSAGLVIINPSDETLAKYEVRKQRYEAYRANILRTSHVTATTVDDFAVEVMGNIELAEEVVSVKDNGGDGIGLFRTEFSYMSRSSYPAEEELFEQYKDIVELMAPNPVTIRTLDINGDKALSYESSVNEENPALGLRAIRFCLKRKDVFMTQLRAILRAAAFGNVRILFPMISSCEEICEAKKLLKQAGDELEHENIPCNTNIEVGIMIEIPSAVIMADSLADVVDYFSIGTNDLVQYTLAIDRGNKNVAHLYNSLHPAVLRMIKQVVDVGKAKNVKVCMCGEMAGDPFNIPILIGLGLTELSMTPQNIPEVKTIIRELNQKECEKFLEDVFTKTIVADIQKLLQDRFGSLIANGYA
ncbi:MAG: phosphoenolpyruvate--protein phosphotransferase [Proteobacteria bacterium]|nr:phosphoenolpyruvate--protein phosphotransferase [Pseudomonadota bacterium]